MSEPGGLQGSTLPVLEKPTQEDRPGAAGPADHRFWSARRVPAGVVATLLLVVAAAFLYDVVAVRAHRSAMAWRTGLARQLAERPLDDIWVLLGAGVAAALGLWLIVLAVTPGLRSVLPMRRTHPDVRAGLDRDAAALVLRDRAMEVAACAVGTGARGPSEGRRPRDRPLPRPGRRARRPGRRPHRRDPWPGPGPAALPVGPCAATREEGVRTMLGTVNRVLVAVVGLVLLAVGGAVLAVGLGASAPSWWLHQGPHDVLLTTAERTRWRADAWWWPTVIAVLALLVLLTLWWLTAVLRRRRLGELLVDTGDGAGALLRGRALEGVLMRRGAAAGRRRPRPCGAEGQEGGARGTGPSGAGAARGPGDGAGPPDGAGPDPRAGLGGARGTARGGADEGRRTQGRKGRLSCPGVRGR